MTLEAAFGLLPIISYVAFPDAEVLQLQLEVP